MRIRFSKSMKQEFSDLAATYEAEFGEVAHSTAIHDIIAEPGVDGDLVMDVTEDLPAFLSSKGFPFSVDTDR